MSNIIYNSGKFRFVTDATVWDETDIGLLLLSVAPAGVFDPDLTTVTELLAVATTTECSGTGYTRKALVCTGPTQDDSNDWISYTATDVVWDSLTLDDDAVAAVVYDETAPADDDRYLLAIYDEGFPAGSSGGDLTLEWSPSGVIIAA